MHPVLFLFLFLVFLQLLISNHLVVLWVVCFGSDIEFHWLKQLFNFLGDLRDWLLNILLFHPTFPLRFELLPVRFNYPRSLLSLAIGFRRVLVVRSFHFNFVRASCHFLLHHECVHVDVRRETPAVGRVADAAVLELLLCGPVDFHVLNHFLIGLNAFFLRPFLLNYLLHSLLVFNLQLVQFV